MTETDSSWPFDVWLRIAVKRFGLSPSEFWSLPLRDWLVLMSDAKPATLDRTRLEDLMKVFPDLTSEGDQNEVGK
ncbi:hypothetical protein GCM10011309_01080 [Litorimonas cladophorae]|uniref:Phage tail assembly chaperone n=1 Tax=Litorimonas cladophorae TaxID=1220491 RepID=A0A918KBJ7_9PROT|nr:phage tail assembly chaperone [Litorimonas cladophorae]GGX56137.1 hypothetical protein GCM10011309_01080 [Litorimonas cladophorae]